MKKERNLLKLVSDADCINASKAAFTNGKNLKAIAEASSNSGFYGSATAHLILSNEEIVKGVLFYAQHIGIDLRNIPSIHLFFTDHIAKHRFSTFLSTMLSFMKLFMGYIKKSKEKLHNPNSIIHYTEAEKAMISQDKSKIQEIFKDLPEMLEWWEDANRQKNKGLYVDYSKSLETPMQITESEYKQALKLVNTFENEVLEAILYFDNLTIQQKKQLIISNKRSDLHKMIIPIIEARKRERRKKD